MAIFDDLIQQERKSMEERQNGTAGAFCKCDSPTEMLGTNDCVNCGKVLAMAREPTESDLNISLLEAELEQVKAETKLKLISTGAQIELANYRRAMARKASAEARQIEQSIKFSEVE